jgi:hypothetical protein
MVRRNELLHNNLLIAGLTIETNVLVFEGK